MMQQQLHGYYATAYCKLWVCFTVHFPQTAITFFHISANPIALSKSLLQHLKRRNHTTFRKKLIFPQALRRPFLWSHFQKTRCRQGTTCSELHHYLRKNFFIYTISVAVKNADVLVKQNRGLAENENSIPSKRLLCLLCQLTASKSTDH